MTTESSPIKVTIFAARQGFEGIWSVTDAPLCEVGEIYVDGADHPKVLVSRESERI